MPLPATVPEISAPTNECPNPQNWRMYDGMATEIETLEFLGSLVRLLKPTVIVETGTYLGYGTYHLASAARANGFGRVHTAEPNGAHLNKACELLAEDNLSYWVVPHLDTGARMIQRLDRVDFAFLDSNLDTRIGEMELLMTRRVGCGVVAVHDTGTQHDLNRSGPRSQFFQFAFDNHMQLINFDTPRGLFLLKRGKVTR